MTRQYKKIMILFIIIYLGLNINLVMAKSQPENVKQEFYKWNKVNGKISPELDKRRTTEADLFTGNTSNKKITSKLTQSSMNEQAFKTYAKTDKELNDVYKQILKKYQDDKVFISKLQKAELAWIKYRDAELEAIYPEKDKTFNYGSAYPMCANYFMTEITKERIKELKLWLKGICEGDVCAGSRRWE